MERIPGALWVLCVACLILMSFMYAKAYYTSLILVAIAVSGTVGLRKLAEYDGAFFAVLLRRKEYHDSYPAYSRFGRKSDG